MKGVVKNYKFSRIKPLTIKVDVTKSGISANGFKIPTTAPSQTYNYNVSWGDGLESFNVSGDIEHIYSIPGIYEIKIWGLFPKFNFFDSGDKLKLIQIVSWGNLDYYSVQNNSFWGCSNLIEFPETNSMWYNAITDAGNFLRGCQLSMLPENLQLNSLTNGLRAFFGNPLSHLPPNIGLNNVTNGQSMFNGCGLTDLPPGVMFSSLTIGNTMFLGNNINPSRYSQLLIEMESTNPNNNVNFHGGSSKYNSSAISARNNLIARGWTITDGGLI